MSLSDYLQSVVVPLINHPEAFRVTETQDQRGILLALDLHPSDMGVIIGKAGETAKAIRYLVRIVGIKNNAHVSIKINEPEGSPYKRKE